MAPADLVIPDAVRALAVNDHGAFFEHINRIDRHRLGADFLDATKAAGRAVRLQEHVELRGRKLLEIGTGCGTTLAVWLREFGVDGWGVEPASLGFEMTYRAARLLFEANGLDPDRIVDAAGECLPFEDASFDIVYSANVLEHTRDPVQVLGEAARVVRPGGIIHFEIPNYLSYFEGHYLVPMPPMVSRRLLALWVRLFGRDPAFVATMTLVNPLWCRRAVRRVGQRYPMRLISLGEADFLDRLARPFAFETQVNAGLLGPTIRVLQAFNPGNWIGRLIVAVQGHYPIYLTLQRL